MTHTIHHNQRTICLLFADIEGEIKYGYTKTKENNVEFFEVGKETITCSADNVMSTLDPALEKALREGNRRIHIPRNWPPC